MTDAARLAELESENARLRADLDAARSATGTATGMRRGRWRTALAVVLLVLGGLLAPVAVVGGWARAQLTDTASFVATFGPLAEDPHVQDLVVDGAADAIDAQIDFDALTAQIVDGIVELGTGPEATAALKALAGPAADGLRSLVRGAIEEFVRSDAFAAIWTESLGITHQQAIAVLQGDGSGALALADDGTLSIKLGPVIEAVKTQLQARGIGLAEQIPVIDAEIVVARAAALVQIRTLYGLATAAGTWLPWIALALLTAAVLVARRPSRMLLAAALVFAGAMAVLVAGFGILSVVLGGLVPADVVPADALAALYGQLVGRMLETAIVGIVLGVLVAIVGWAAGPFPRPRAWRAVWNGWMRRLRAAADAHGIGTGATGRWIGRHVREFRVAILVIAALVIVFVRPLTVSLVVWTLVLALLAVVVLELVQRPAGESADEPAGDPAEAPADGPETADATAGSGANRPD